MPTQQDILNEIRRTAKENGGIPLGSARFEKETGINAYEWGRHWARFGDAVKAAGLEPNTFKAAHPDEFLITKIIGLARKLSKFPTFREFQVEKSCDPQLPDKKVFQRFGTKRELALKVTAYCENKKDHQDIIDLCAPILNDSASKDEHESSDDSMGEVYLFKFGHYFKIGKTNDTVRRGRELRIQLPDKPILIHSIRTDDPSGIETYWKKRFALQKLNDSEFFDLNSSDIRAFKRWRRIY